MSISFNIRKLKKAYHIAPPNILNDVLDEVSVLGSFPNLLKRSLVEGFIRTSSYDKPEPEFMESSAKYMLQECSELLKGDYPLSRDTVKVLEHIASACRYAIKKGEDIEII